ncbi:acetoin utilization protein AcuC [Ruegeria hyattellae]|uniref:acetoin utilization protein AcuC n=1 Tax=Ruegeria hyattellae TaxID=3233337 RepID=UPI00355B2A87
MPAPILIGSEIYRGSSYGVKHPLAIPRVSTVLDLCRSLGWLPKAQYRTSPRAKPAALTGFHTERYINALQAAEKAQQVSDETRSRHGLGTLSNPVFPEMYRRPATAAGGSILGADLVARGGLVFNPGGGTHHGHPDRANGFCYLNDPVLAIRRLIALGQQRVAYVDIDAHHCDGVEAAFVGERRLRLISVHEQRRWPFTGKLSDQGGGTAYNLPVPRGFNDSEFHALCEAVILPLLSDFRPDVLILQCGADAVDEDPLSRLALSNTAHWHLLGQLMGLSDKMLVLGGGGYNPWSVARLWTGLWAVLNGHDLPGMLPDDAQEVLARLRWTRKTGNPPAPHWIATLRDTPRPGPVRDETRHIIAHMQARMATRT